jgi:type II secretory pathway component PulJ
MGTGQIGDKNMDVIKQKTDKVKPHPDFSAGGFQRGQIYSLVAVLIALPLFLFITFYISTSQTIETTVKDRIVADQLHQTEKIMEKDFSNAIGIIGKRAGLAATNHVVLNGIPLASGNAASVIRELMLNGSLYGNASLIMVNNTIGDWRSRILNVDTGFITRINYSNLNIDNQDGFNLKADVDLEINASDISGAMRIDKALEKHIPINLEGLEDPIFALNTSGFVTRIIRKYPYPYYANKTVTGTGSAGNCSGIVSFDYTGPDSKKILINSTSGDFSGWAGAVIEEGVQPTGVSCYVFGAADAINRISYTVQESNYSYIYLDNLTTSAWSLPIKEGIEQGYYYPGNGPTFLERLEGKMTSSTNSFETFVNKDEFDSVGISIKPNQISVAHLYFQDQIINGVIVRGLPDWFRINSTYAEKYNLSELI